MTQVIGFIGGEYRNRTGVHGFAIPMTPLISLHLFEKWSAECLWSYKGLPAESKMQGDGYSHQILPSFVIPPVTWQPAENCTYAVNPVPDHPKTPPCSEALAAWLRAPLSHEQRPLLCLRKGSCVCQPKRLTHFEHRLLSWCCSGQEELQIRRGLEKEQY